jgi:uncharacterized membrane protein
MNHSIRFHNPHLRLHVIIFLISVVFFLSFLFLQSDKRQRRQHRVRRRRVRRQHQQQIFFPPCISVVSAEQYNDKNVQKFFVASVVFHNNMHDK